MNDIPKVMEAKKAQISTLNSFRQFLPVLLAACATKLLKAGMRLECLQQLLGHSSIEMTRRYARLTDNTRREE